MTVLAANEAAPAETKVRERINIKASLQRAYLAVLFLTTLAYGSATSLGADLSALAFAGLTLASLAFPIASVRLRRLQALAAALAAILLFYAYAQTLPLAAGSTWAHPAWDLLESRLGGGRGFLGVSPGLTLDALPALALPFLVFLSGLALFPDDRAAVWLWRALAGFGIACAIYGLIQELLFPEQLLFETKQYYVGSLTGAFVNRNTAGTFFGLALLLTLSLLFRDLKKVRLASVFNKAVRFELAGSSARVLGLTLAALTVAVALFLTLSRGALGATFIGVVLAVTLFSLRPMTADRTSPLFARWRGAVTLLGGILAVVGVFSLFAERSVYRMQEQGTNDARWCAYGSTWEAIRDNWKLGTGFGTFRDVFPMYRHAECAGIFGYWDRAHDVYLEGFLGFGILFPIVLLIGVTALVWTLVRGVRLRRSLRHIPIAGLSGLVLTMLHSAVDFSLQIPGFNVYFAAAMAAAVTVSLGR